MNKDLYEAGLDLMRMYGGLLQSGNDGLLGDFLKHTTIGDKFSGDEVSDMAHGMSMTFIGILDDIFSYCRDEKEDKFKSTFYIIADKSGKEREFLKHIIRGFCCFTIRTREVQGLLTNTNKVYFCTIGFKDGKTKKLDLGEVKNRFEIMDI